MFANNGKIKDSYRTELPQYFSGLAYSSKVVEASASFTIADGISQSNKTFFVTPVAGAATVITLPAAQTGWKGTVILAADADAGFPTSITSPVASKVDMLSLTTGTVAEAAAQTTVSFGNGSKAGSKAEIVCDGDKFHVMIISSTAPTSS